MSENVIAYALLFGWCGFSWGQWWAERHPKRPDTTLKILAVMLTDITERRKLVGRAMTISSTHRFEAVGEKLSLKLEAEGDPRAFIEGEVVR